MKTVAVLLFCIPVLAQADALDELRSRLAAETVSEKITTTVILETGRK